MNPTDAEYWRDAVAMAVADSLDQEAVVIAINLATTGEQFNAAIWAAIRLSELVDA